MSPKARTSCNALYLEATPQVVLLSYNLKQMTNGYRVYRHKNIYHVCYIQCNGNPDRLGLWTIAEIPKDRECYSAWLLSARKRLDMELENSKGAISMKHIPGCSCLHFITRVQPMKSARVHWVWEVDLDNEILHVDSRPFFHLSNLPRDAAFLFSISRDHYGHRACAPNTPPEHSYTWARPHPITLRRVNPTYDALVKAHGGLDHLPELEAAGPRAAVRSSVYQVIVGAAMRTWAFAYEIPRLSIAPHRIPSSLRYFADALLRLPFEPMVIDAETVPPPGPSPSLLQDGHHWLRGDVCVRLASRLDEVDSYEEDVLALVNAIRQHSDLPPYTKYGILFSFLHILIVRVTAHGVSHTPPLPFLPSFFAKSPSTPGISALISLAHNLNTHIPSGHRFPSTLTNPSLPTEIWSQIASYLTDVNDLRNMGIITIQARSAANEFLQYPWIGGHRVLKSLSGPVHRDWASPQCYRAYREGYVPQEGVSSLYSQRFEVVNRTDGKPMIVEVASGDTPLRASFPASVSSSCEGWDVLQQKQVDIVPEFGGVGVRWAVKYRAMRARSSCTSI